MGLLCIWSYRLCLVGHSINSCKKTLDIFSSLNRHDWLQLSTNIELNQDEKHHRFIFWCIIAYDGPDVHPWIGAQEKVAQSGKGINPSLSSLKQSWQRYSCSRLLLFQAFIQSSLIECETGRPSKIPWAAIATSPAVSLRKSIFTVGTCLLTLQRNFLFLTSDASMLKFAYEYHHLLILIDRSDNLNTAYHWDWKYCHLPITGVGHHHDPRDSKLRLLRASHWAAVLHEEYSSFWYEEQCCSFRFMNIASNDCLIFHYIHQPTMFSGVPYLVMWFVALGGSFTVDKLIGEN